MRYKKMNYYELLKKYKYLKKENEELKEELEQLKVNETKEGME
jgi:DNA-binding protein YbaB